MLTNGLVSASAHPSLAHTKLHLGHSFVWTHVFPESSQAPMTRAKHATCLHNGAIYLYGGVCGNVALKDMWRFEPGPCVWTKIECRGDTPPLLQDHIMVGYKNTIYIFGGLCGFDDPDETALWMLDLEQYVWSKQVICSEVMTPASRRGHTVVLHRDGMHIFGGHVDLKGSTNEMWTLDFETLCWHTWVYNNQEPAPPPRHGHSAVIRGSCMFVYGGSNNLQPLKDMWKWDFDCLQWSKVRFWQGPPALHGHTAVTLGDSMMVYGGEDSGGILRSELWVFSYSSENWTKMSYKGSVIPSPTVHHTLEMNIPDSDALFPPQEERSLSAPFLQRPSQSSLHVTPLPRPHSSPAYALEPQGKSRGRTRTFKNRVHPLAGESPNLSSADDAHRGNVRMMDGCNGDDEDSHDDDDDDENDEEEEEEEDLYESRVFIPVWEALNASREQLLGSSLHKDSTCNTRRKRTGRVTPERESVSRHAAVMMSARDVCNGHREVSSSDSRMGKHGDRAVPRVQIDDFDERSAVQSSHINENMNDKVHIKDLCNNQPHLLDSQRVIKVMPISQSDRTPLIRLNGTLDDLCLTEASKSQDHLAFDNAGFTAADEFPFSGRPRSNSLTSLQHKLHDTPIASDVHYKSFNDLPNMATLLLERQRTKQRNRTNPRRREHHKQVRPKLRKRSQTDHSLYLKSVQYANEGCEVEKFPDSGKGRHHLLVPVHLYAFGGQEPNISSLHKYQTRMPVFRCTIVPGKPTPSQIQALLH
ncbi:uncharacterized protein [Diadema antillarum]|uniref:uncharacterized protein n=1 Tax=Diadema antillarum TaxID=105358 RepID=UPI003A87429C